MNHYKKRLVKNGIVIPIAAAVVVTALFFAVLTAFSDEFPYVKNTDVTFAYETAEVIEAETVDASGDTVSKKDMPAIAGNTVIGSIEANGKSLKLIYNPNDVNALGKMSISKDSRLIGEIGTVFASCYKADSAFVKSLKEGDTVKVETNYSSFTFEVVNIKTVNDLDLAKKAGDGIGRALVLCTDSSDNVGISGSYLTVVCKMTSGIKVTE